MVDVHLRSNRLLPLSLLHLTDCTRTPNDCCRMNLLTYAKISLLAVTCILSSVQSLPTSQSFKGVGKSLQWHHGLFENLRAGVQKSAHTLLHYQTEVSWGSFFLSAPRLLILSLRNAHTSRPSSYQFCIGTSRFHSIP